MNRSKIRILSCLAVFCLILSSCALNFEPKDLENNQPQPEYPDKPVAPDLVEVQFLVKTSTRFSEKDALALDVLDLVAGTRHNVERYRLNPSGSDSYRVTIALPEGATIAYRYSMLEPMQLTEILPDGTEVSFRQLFVKKNLIISDIISGWPEKPYNSALANLNGAVADNVTEQPLADVLVNVAGKTAMTDMNGRFYLRDIPVGVHNLVATTLNGSHQTFQQEVNLVDGLSTLAIARMLPNPKVTLTFTVSASKEVYGAPIRIGGNLQGFGQTLADQVTGQGVLPVNMPVLTENSDGSYVTQIETYAGNVLRYSYTLGDAVTGVERNEQGLRAVRQFVVPDSDAVIRDTIVTWRSSNAAPTAIYAVPPEGTPQEDSLYIQFNQGYWSRPIPMWKSADGNWVTVYFPASAEPNEVQYRYCRFSDCDLGGETNPNVTMRSYLIESQSEIHDQISGWNMFDPQAAASDAISPISFAEGSLVGLELDPVYSSEYLKSFPRLLEELQNSRFNWIIFRPSWKVSTSEDLPYIDPDPATTIPSAFLTQLAEKLGEAGIKTAIYPKLDFSSFEQNWWQETSKNSLWWQQWYSEYERMVTHLIKLATHIKADQLILGGPDVWQSYPGALETAGSNYGTPKSSEEIWTELLKKVDQYYEGSILLAHSLDEMDARAYSFYNQIDGLYLLINSDFSINGAYTSENVSQYLDSVIYSMVEGQEYSLYLGLNGPSFQTSSTDAMTNDSQPISPTDDRFGSYNVNLYSQTGFYAAYLEAIAARGWIGGVSSRGYFPGIKLTDFSASINGKPAFQFFHNQ